MDEDGWTAIKPYVQNMKMNYRVLLGNDDVSTAYGGLDSLPTTLLIDRQGKIASVHVGVTMGKEEFKNAIVQLLNAPHDQRFCCFSQRPGPAYSPRRPVTRF